MPLRVPAILLVAALAACASTNRTAVPASPGGLAAPPATAGSLARFATEPVIVLPLQGLAASARQDWRAAAGTERTLVPHIDSLFEAELTGRRLGATWAFPSALVRAARRNPTYLVDPYSIRATPAIVAHLRKPDNPLAEPLASQVRAFAGVGGARYALIPMDLRFDSVSAGGQAAMRFAIVDTRAVRVTWWGEVQGAPGAAYSPLILSELIQRAADLVIPR